MKRRPVEYDFERSPFPFWVMFCAIIIVPAAIGFIGYLILT